MDVKDMEKTESTGLDDKLDMNREGKEGEDGERLINRYKVTVR